MKSYDPNKSNLIGLDKSIKSQLQEKYTKENINNIKTRRANILSQTKNKKDNK